MFTGFSLQTKEHHEHRKSDLLAQMADYSLEGVLIHSRQLNVLLTTGVGRVGTRDLSLFQLNNQEIISKSSLLLQHSDLRMVAMKEL